MKNRNIKVGYLARVEGEGALHIKVKDEQVAEVQLRIFEPPRFFEAFLRGRHYSEVPDLVARICGICPIAYQMGAVHAIEDAFGVQVTGPLRALRRLIYCGEWIESHVLHVALLHAPDFLGYQDAIRLAQDQPEVVQLALKLKKTGNNILDLLGGRAVHPVSVCVGGFYRVPTRRELIPLREELLWARDAAQGLVKWVAGFEFPDFTQDYQFVALRHPDEYPLNEGRLVSNQGLDIALAEYEQNFLEEDVAHSHALHSVNRMNGTYAVGPLARYSLNFDKLTPLAQEAARAAGLGMVCTNPFQSIIVRSVETLYALEEALRIIDEYEMPDAPVVAFEPRAGTGYGCTEAPRGICYHRYRIDEEGLIADAKIVPPTSQNQKIIEDDLRRFVPDRLHLSDEKLVWQCEQAVRNYDPCISCATHFLRLHLERE